ncbi:MAG: hypothetical protein JO345_30655 [Streptosporangiaceae bacterium]|nr:hypothetical protein [Streptosporangiaceae bacterium]
MPERQIGQIDHGFIVMIAPGIRWNHRGNLRWSQGVLETYYAIGEQTLYIRPVTSSRRLADMITAGTRA